VKDVKGLAVKRSRRYGGTERGAQKVGEDVQVVE
jgi:hypothetical protein